MKVQSISFILYYPQESAPGPLELSIGDPGVPKMPFHMAYGLAIQSEFEIPELLQVAPSGVTPEIQIRLGKLESGELADPQGKGCAYRVNSDEYLYIKNRCGRFLAKGGREIIVDPDPGVEDRVWRLSLFGPALGLLLIQRGYLVLHGGAVVVPGGAVLLLGPAGMGKSTLTAELCRQGARLLTDDVVTIDTDDSPPRALPGVPMLKLWPDAVDDAPKGTWTRVLHPDFDKVGRRMDEAAIADPAPVARVFILARGEQLMREPLTGNLAFRSLMASQFAARYGQVFISGLDGRELLARMTKLLQHAPVEILRRPRDRSLLGETARMVAESVKSN